MQKNGFNIAKNPFHIVRDPEYIMPFLMGDEGYHIGGRKTPTINLRYPVANIHHTATQSIVSGTKTNSHACGSVIQKSTVIIPHTGVYAQHVDF